MSKSSNNFCAVVINTGNRTGTFATQKSSIEPIVFVLALNVVICYVLHTTASSAVKALARKQRMCATVEK